MSAFMLLIEHKDIERGDAIIIFYAGHGSEAKAPPGWASDNGKIETICPYDEQTIADKKFVFGITDRTFNGLLRKLADAKGDNIVRI